MEVDDRNFEDKVKKDLVWTEYNKIGVRLQSNGHKKSFPWWERIHFSHGKCHQIILPVVFLNFFFVNNEKKLQSEKEPLGHL